VLVLLNNFYLEILMKEEWSEYWIKKAEQHYDEGKETLSWLVLFLNYKFT